MKKTLLILLLLVLCIPVITFAADVPPGQPFQQLSNQINEIKIQLQDLTTRFQNIDNTSASHTKEINAINNQLLNVTQKLEVIGISRVIHGSSGENGEWLAGEHWSLLYNGNYDCQYYEYVISLDSMTNPTAPPPHCVVVPSWTKLSGVPCPGTDYDFYPIGMRVTTYYGGWDAPNWTLAVQMRWWIAYGYAFPYQTQFDFICVQ